MHPVKVISKRMVSKLAPGAGIALRLKTIWIIWVLSNRKRVIFSNCVEGESASSKLILTSRRTLFMHDLFKLNEPVVLRIFLEKGVYLGGTPGFPPFLQLFCYYTKAFCKKVRSIESFELTPFSTIHYSTIRTDISSMTSSYWRKVYHYWTNMIATSQLEFGTKKEVRQKVKFF